jgi:MFS family permease
MAALPSTRSPNSGLTFKESHSMNSAHAPSADKHDQILFWGCFIALITTAFGFIARMFLIKTWADEFGLDPAEAGRLQGIGLWPFAVSIIGFSLLIDKIGYKVAMIFAFLGHITWAVMGVGAYYLSHEMDDKATAYQLLYWGSLVLALANGTVEAFINPVVATMFSKEKTKWLNILHAGWPGGLVIAGVITIYLNHLPWGVKVGLLAAPAVIYFLMLVPLKFPVQERETAGVTYKDMLAEFGVLGAALVGFLVALQLMDFFKDAEAFTKLVDNKRVLEDWAKMLFAGIGVAIVVLFGLYTQALGRLLMFFLVLIMMPLATTEIGTDGWITAIMESVAKEGGFHPGWILVYTSVIMMVLRFFAGPIVHSISPLGLLAISSLLAWVGLVWLADAVGYMIFVAATIYAFGKTFFWPTMLGVVSEQTPKGGALTLNAISGLGMLAVGTLGTTYIGTLQADKQIAAVEASPAAKEVSGLIVDGKVTAVESKSIYEILKYDAIDDSKLKALVNELPAPQSAEVAESIKKARDQSNQKALRDMATFPAFMLVCYLLLIGYFRAKGGYKPVHLSSEEVHPATEG